MKFPPWRLAFAAAIAFAPRLFADNPRATVPNPQNPSVDAPPGMVWIPGGEFSMGTTDPTKMACDGAGHDPMPDARPVHRVAVDGFWMDATAVTNEQFDRFVKATGYVTEAERKPKAEDFPGASPEMLVPGSIVYYQTLASAGDVPRNPQGPPDSFDPSEPGVPKRVQRGGSFLCSDQYCSRYMVGSRGKGEPSSSANHIGFRCVLSAAK